MEKPARSASGANRPWSPLYTQEDALGACGLLRPCRYGQRVEVCPGVSIRMVDVGLLGSASIEVRAEGTRRVIVFPATSATLHQLPLRDPQYLHAAGPGGDGIHLRGPFPRPRADYLSALSRVHCRKPFDRR